MNAPHPIFAGVRSGASCAGPRPPTAPSALASQAARSFTPGPSRGARQGKRPRGPPRGWLELLGARPASQPPPTSLAGFLRRAPRARPPPSTSRRRVCYFPRSTPGARLPLPRLLEPAWHAPWPAGALQRGTGGCGPKSLPRAPPRPYSPSLPRRGQGASGGARPPCPKRRTLPEDCGAGRER